MTIAPRAPHARALLESVTYVSSAVGGLTDADLEGLLTSARRRNEEQGVTGALLFHDGSFFQYFEGPPEGVEVVYGHIRGSRLHGGIIELDRSAVPARQFPRWLMGFTHVPASSILRLSGASWRAAVRGMAGAEIRAEGMALLLNFWRSTGQRGD